MDTNTDSVNILPIDGEEDYALIVVIRDGKEYTMRMLVFTEKEMEVHHRLVEKLQTEGKLP